ncbi:MAG: alpha/beta hydrolase [Frankiales bacterium]|nr:alpha/beta hydrolase [Frankiales bacterium]
MTETLQANGIEIAYETFGDPDARPLVLVMGLNTQMIAWPDELCEDLAKAGHWVIRYDNRDIGESTHFRDAKAPSIGAVLTRRTKPPYTVSDMGRDLLGLLDALGIESAHVVGASMGGFIAQSAAIQAPERIRSLTLIMTSTGSRKVGRVSLGLIPRMLTRRVIRNRDEAGEAAVETFHTIGSPGFPFDDEWYREIGRRSYDRSHDTGGYRRQLAAVLAQSDRTTRLRQLDTPALVIHGLADPLVAPTGGLALSRALKNSRFIGVPGMGHDLPRALWPEFAADITELTDRADD